MADEQKEHRRSKRQRTQANQGMESLAQFARKKKDQDDFLIILRHDNPTRPDLKHVWFHDANEQPDDGNLHTQEEYQDWTGVTCSLDLIPESKESTGAIIQHVHSIDNTVAIGNADPAKRTTLHKEAEDDPDNTHEHVFENWQVFQGKLENDEKNNSDNGAGDNWAIWAPHSNKTSGTYIKEASMYYVFDQGEIKKDKDDLLPPQKFLEHLGLDEWDDGVNWWGWGKKITSGTSPTFTLPDRYKGSNRLILPHNGQLREVSIDWGKPMLTRRMELMWPRGLPEDQFKNFKPDLKYTITIHNSPRKVVALLHPKREKDADFTKDELFDLVWVYYFPFGLPPDQYEINMGDNFVSITVRMSGNYSPAPPANDDDDDDGGGDDDDDSGDDEREDIEPSTDPGGPSPPGSDNNNGGGGGASGNNPDIIDLTEEDGSKEDPITFDDLMLGTIPGTMPMNPTVSDLYDLSNAGWYAADVASLRAEMEAILDHEMAVKHQKGKYPSIRGRTYKGLTSWQCRAFKNKGRGPRCTQFTRERFPFCNFHSSHTGGRIDKRHNSYTMVNGKKQKTIRPELVVHRNVNPGHLIGVVSSVFAGTSDAKAHKCKLDHMYTKARDYWASNYIQEKEGQIQDQATNLTIDFSVPNTSSVGRYATMISHGDDDRSANAVAVLAKMKVAYQDCTTTKETERPVIAMFADKEAVAKGEEVVLKVYDDDHELDVVQC